MKKSEAIILNFKMLKVDSFLGCMSLKMGALLIAVVGFLLRVAQLAAFIFFFIGIFQQATLKGMAELFCGI